jgi:glycosyltransferase involved in cell wall biosynthesis
MADRRVHILCPHLTPYNDFLFRKIAEALPGAEVIYRNQALGSHPWKSELGSGYRMRYERRFLGFSWSTILLAFRWKPALFLVEGWDSPTSMVLLTVLRLLGRNFAIWTDTPNLDRSGPWLREKLRSAWLRWIFRGAAANMGTGVPGVDGLRVMGAPEQTLVNFPFVLDLQAYTRPRPSSADARPMQFVSSGRVLNRLKGHDLAIQAFERASKRCGIPFKYFIAGTGPDSDALAALCRRLGLEDSVTLMGWVEPGDLRALLRASDVLIHPSPVQDPFPNAVLEGMAAGMAVLGSSACGSVVDRVSPGVSGLVHDSGSIDGLARDIEWCLRNPAAVADMGRRCESIAARWPVERSVEIVRDLADGRFPPLATAPWPASEEKAS